MKSEFRKRIEKAAAGRLNPVDEVKAVDEQHTQPLYEIRWQDIPVTEREHSEAPLRHLQILVRLYHSEPASEPDYFIGHHIHEKVVGPDVNVRHEQDTEIAVARGIYDMGEGIRWHLP